MLASEASEAAGAAAAARQPTMASSPGEGWIAGADVNGRGADLQHSASSSNIISPGGGSDSSGRPLPHAVGDVDSLNYAFLAMERCSLEASWK